MTDSPVYLRCGSCGTVNRLPASRLVEHPKCGKCKNLIEIPNKPVDITTADFDREVLARALYWLNSGPPGAGFAA